MLFSYQSLHEQDHVARHSCDFKCQSVVIHLEESQFSKLVPLKSKIMPHKHQNRGADAVTVFVCDILWFI